MFYTCKVNVPKYSLFVLTFIIIVRAESRTDYWAQSKRFLLAT